MEPTSSLLEPPSSMSAQETTDSSRQFENPELESEQLAEYPAKRIKLDPNVLGATLETSLQNSLERRKGIAPVKKEFLLVLDKEPSAQRDSTVRDDDYAEAAAHLPQDGDKKKAKRREKKSGQNTGRKFGKSEDEKQLCQTIAHRPEFSPKSCPFGDKCKFEHDLRKYLKEFKREDLKTFDGVCPVWNVRGSCPSGWKCRFVGSHMAELETSDGRKELVLVEDEARKGTVGMRGKNVDADSVTNVVPAEKKIMLMKKKLELPKSEAYTAWLDESLKQVERNIHAPKNGQQPELQTNGDSVNEVSNDELKDNRSSYVEPPFLPSEKRRIYFGPDTPVLAPLTTQGNLPFRRVCVELGAQFTYSEMAMSLRLVQGSKAEWALMKAHESETTSPTVNRPSPVVQAYDQSRDFRFGAQIASSKPWQALKATEALTTLCPHLRVIDLNCGCPIDLVYRDGAGSALLDQASKLEKILRGMNAVSQDVPITAKIRMGTKDGSPTAHKLAERLVLGGFTANELGMGPPGVAAITLHGRSRQQRYSRQADWGYISECAALIKRLNAVADTDSDTVRQPDERFQPPGGHDFLLGNGDCYSHEDYYRAINDSGVDSVMIARGALIKPWIFEEIEKGQYLDKSASERLSLIEKFAKFGLETWGSDEHGVGTTRRFLLEWLSFTHRYVPVGILEYLPPNIQDRPPAWRGRNELETLLASDSYRDWIKISEMFLGPAHKNFRFEPKHKSNSYEVVAEG